MRHPAESGGECHGLLPAGDGPGSGRSRRRAPAARVDDALSLYPDVEIAAASHVVRIRETAGSDTVDLLGHSFGGWVTFETACRLTAAGLTVRQLAVVDSRSPGGTRRGLRGRLQALLQLKQTFSSRDADTRMSFELIQRSGEDEFLEENVKSLFEQLENADSF